MSELPKATHSSELQIAGLTLKVHVLDNGQRVIEAGSVAEFFQFMESSATIPESDLVRLAQWLGGAES